MYWGALKSVRTESASPQLMARARVRLSGWLSDLARSLPRAFRFATHYPGGSLHENFPQQNRSGSGTRSRGYASTTPESKSEPPTCGGRSPLFHRCPAHPAEVCQVWSAPAVAAPVHKQIRHNVPFCARRFFSYTVHGAEGELTRSGKRSPSGGFL